MKLTRKQLRKMIIRERIMLDDLPSSDPSHPMHGAITPPDVANQIWDEEGRIRPQQEPEKDIEVLSLESVVSTLINNINNDERIESEQQKDDHIKRQRR